MTKPLYTCEYDGCEKVKEGYPRDRSKKYCATHEAGFRRLAKDLAKVPKKPKPIAKASEGRKMVNDVYSGLRKDYLVVWPNCELGPILKSIGVHVCTKHSTTIHHCSTSAENFLNSDTWLGGCMECHRYVEEKLPAEQRRELQLLYD